MNVVYFRSVNNSCLPNAILPYIICICVARSLKATYRLLTEVPSGEWFYSLILVSSRWRIYY